MVTGNKKNFDSLIFSDHALKVCIMFEDNFFYMKPKHKILIIGGYEGIGSRLAKLYLNNGDQVFATYSRFKPKDFNSKNISFFF